MQDRTRTLSGSRLAAAALTAASMLLAAAVATISASPQGRDGAAGPQMPQMDEATLLKEGKALTEEICSECHELDSVYIRRKSRKEWVDTVADMGRRGAQATDAQLTTVRLFLTRTYGTVAVNTAPADELTAVLGLSAKDAAAVVEYRKINGDFTDRASLAKVPGIDQAKIDEQPDALVFKKSS